MVRSRSRDNGNRGVQVVQGWGVRVVDDNGHMAFVQRLEDSIRQQCSDRWTETGRE